MAAADDNKTQDSVSQKLVVITGASSGIGQECVKPFLLAGHPVLMLARNVANMESGRTSIALELSSSSNNNKSNTDYESLMFIKKCDVTAEAYNKDTDTHSVDSAITSCIEENKDLNLYVDCLINNAGVMLLSPVESQTMDKMKLMLNVNILGVLNGLKAVVSGMKQRKQGTIINISSMAGKKHFDNHTVYCATKFAVQALTEGLRQELAGSNVKVSVICPGAVETNLLSHNTADVVDGYSGWKKSMSLGVLMPEDVSNSCYFVYNSHPRCCVREIQLAPVNQVP